MPLRRETLAAVGEEIAGISIEGSDLDQQVAALGPLLEEIKRLRSLSLKDCEPPLIFAPLED